MSVFGCKPDCGNFLPGMLQLAMSWLMMGRRQVVRHWVLVPAFAGSNPAVPAILANYQAFARKRVFFVEL